MKVLQSDQTSKWMEVVGRCPTHDFFHLPSYHLLEGARSVSTGYLFVYEDGIYTIALPLLVRSLRAEPSLQPLEEDLKDATSVYGYAGPISSHVEVPDAICERFRAELKDCLLKLGVVSVFSRLHPLIPHAGLLSGLGELRALGKTISVDLTLPKETLWKQTRRCHRDSIKKLRNLGVRCFEDEEQRHFPVFEEIYEETMRRVGADAMYFFGNSYFDGFARALGNQNHLFVAMLDGEVMAGAIFAGCSTILQYHLSGTRDKFRTHAPMTLILDTARQWAAEQNFHVMHLGGGVGSREDSLFHFKSGFSDRRHEFVCWRWILCPKRYSELCNQVEWFAQQNGLVRTAPGFFPEYRRPMISEDERALV